jgi:hypothetical protein
MQRPRQESDSSSHPGIALDCVGCLELSWRCGRPQIENPPASRASGGGLRKLYSAQLGSMLMSPAAPCQRTRCARSGATTWPQSERWLGNRQHKHPITNRFRLCQGYICDGSPVGCRVTGIRILRDLEFRSYVSDQFERLTDKDARMIRESLPLRVKNSLSPTQKMILSES